jgi:hypothetical protein
VKKVLGAFTLEIYDQNLTLLLVRVDSPVSGTAAKSGTLFKPLDEQKLLNKIDLRILPMLFLIYIAAFLDRFVESSFGRKASLLRDLGLIYPMHSL